MIETLLPGVCAAVVLAYWSLCRRSALRHQQKTVELIEAYLENVNVHDIDKESMYWTYRLARTWFFMPAMALLSPFIMLPMLNSDTASQAFDKKGNGFDEIMECMVKMYVTRNPLTAMLSLTVLFVTFAVILPIGLLLNRVKHIPSLPMVFGAAASKVSDIRNSHAH